MKKKEPIIEEKKEHKLLKKISFIFLGIALIIISILLYSRYIGTTGLTIKEYKITNNKITDNFHGLKIVHISDIHYGRTINEDELKNLVDKINLTKPDIVVLTGDLLDRDTKIDGSMSEIISNNLKNIKTTIGKYAISGNHDYKQSKWELIIENSGFINLNDKYDTIYKDTNDYIILTGVSTNSYGDKKIDEKIIQTKQYLSDITDENLKPKYSVLMLHEPDFIKDIDLDMFDLVLAGHSHNGQVRLPFIGSVILPPNAKKYYDEYYKINNTDLYISSGLGVSNINFRLFNRPSFNLYRLTNS